MFYKCSLDFNKCLNIVIININNNRAKKMTYIIITVGLFIFGLLAYLGIAGTFEAIDFQNELIRKRSKNDNR